MTDYLWLLVALPMIGAVINLFLGRRLGEPASGWFAFLIVAAGFPKAVTADMIKPGATVIGVGVNRVGEKPSKKDPNRMVAILKGDVDFDAVKEKASAITPVPGGVGPMTITMLMKKTVRAAKQRL